MNTFFTLNRRVRNGAGVCWFYAGVFSALSLSPPLGNPFFTTTYGKLALILSATLFFLAACLLLVHFQRHRLILDQTGLRLTGLRGIRNLSWTAVREARWVPWQGKLIIKSGDLPRPLKLNVFCYMNWENLILSLRETIPRDYQRGWERFAKRFDLDDHGRRQQSPFWVIPVHQDLAARNRAEWDRLFPRVVLGATALAVVPLLTVVKLEPSLFLLVYFAPMLLILYWPAFRSWPPWRPWAWFNFISHRRQSLWNAAIRLYAETVLLFMAIMFCGFFAFAASEPMIRWLFPKLDGTNWPRWIAQVVTFSLSALVLHRVFERCLRCQRALIEQAEAIFPKLDDQSQLGP